MSMRTNLSRAAVALLLLALTACALRPPISVAVRESLVGQGLVIAVTNTSDEFLHEVTVEIESPSGETRKYFQATLDPHDSVRVGWLKLDGWPIPQDSEVAVSCKGYLLAAGPWKLSG
ncbi:MAG: hypothetical protein GY856_27480 [bacterium]|nr:hypothetical protein [bacterium]